MPFRNLLRPLLIRVMVYGATVLNKVLAKDVAPFNIATYNA